MSTRIARGLALTAGLGALIAAPAQAHDWHGRPNLEPGNLLVSESSFTTPDIQPGVTELPPGCTGTGCTPAVADGAYPFVFNNDSADGNFGVTSKVLLDELTPWGDPIAKIRVPDDQFVRASRRSPNWRSISAPRDATSRSWATPRARQCSTSRTPTPRV